MKILLAGGGGYIGTYLTEKLINLNHHITVIDLFWFNDNLPNNITKIKKNLFDCDESDFKGIDQVIFLGGLSNDPMANFSPNLNFIYNSSLPMFLAYLSKKAGVKRFIYASSCSVYGFTNNISVDEKYEAKCDFPYGISKYLGEKSVYFLNDNNFSVICLRMGTVCGYSKRMRLDTVINAMFKDCVTKQCITVNNKNICRPILSINDACNAYIKSIDIDYKISDIFNISSENINIGDLAKRIANKMQQYLNKEITINIKNIDDNRNYVVSIEKAKQVLNFVPNDNVETIIDDLYNNIGSFSNSFDDDIYYNIKIFKKIVSTIKYE